MKIFVIVLLIIILFLLILGYCLLVIAGEAEERAERMYRAWKESIDEREQKISNR